MVPHSDLQRVVLRIGIRRKRLEIGWPDPEVRRPRRRVFDGTIHDRALRSRSFRSVAIHPRYHHRVLRRRQRGFRRIIRRAQMRALRADVSDFKEPLSSQFTLYGHVPLLRRPRNQMLWHLKRNQAAHVAAESSATLRGNTRRAARWAQRASGWKPSEEGRLRHKRRTQHPEWRNAREACGRVGLEQIRQTSRTRQEINRNREKRRRERQVVHRPQILAHAVNPVTAADGSVVVAKQVIGKTDAWLLYGGKVIAQRTARLRPGQARKIVFIHALRINERLPGGIGKFRDGIADAAAFVVRRSNKLLPESEIQREQFGNTVIVLREPRIRRNPVVVIPNSAAGFAKKRRSCQKALKIRACCWRRKEDQSVVRHRQTAAQCGPVNLAAKAEGMIPARPPDCVQYHKAVPQRPLQLLRKWSKGECPELQAVNVEVAVSSGQIDPHVLAGHWRHVV